MNVAFHPPRMTRDQFLDWAEKQEQPYEFDGERPLPMIGHSQRHGLIMANIITALRPRLRGSPCRVLVELGVPTLGQAVRCPDVLVTCTAEPGRARLVTGAVVVFEIVSPSTEQLDRVVKRDEYAAVPSIRRYVLVEQDRPSVTVLSRSDVGADWERTELGAGETLALPEIGVTIPVAEFYEDVEFED